MSPVQFKALLNVACKVDYNACTFFLGDRLNVPSDGCLQCSNATRVALVDDILEEHHEEEIWEFQAEVNEVPILLQFCG